MVFAANAVGVLAAGIQGVFQHRIVAEGRPVLAQRLFGDFKNANALNIAGGTRKVLVDQGRAEPDGFKDLRAGVRHIGRNAHFGHDFIQALADRLDVVLGGFFRVVERGQGFKRQVRVNRFGAVTAQQGHMVHLAHRARFHDQAGFGAQAGADQVQVNGRRGQQRGNGDPLGVDLAVGDNQNVVAAMHRIGRVRTERGNTGFDAVRAPGRGVGNVQFEAAELVRRNRFDITDLRHSGQIQHRLGHFQAQRRVDVVDVQQIGFGSNERHQRHHHLLAYRVDRGVGDLGKQLAEIVVERLGAA